MRAVPFTRFVRDVLGVQLTRAQHVADAVAFDGVEPRAFKGEDRRLARELFGSVDVVPALARGVVVRVKGARSGDSWRSALRGVHLAVTHGLETLAPGEPAYVVFCAPDTRLARIPLGYAKGAIEHVPALARLVETETADSLTLRRDDGRVVRFEALPATSGGSALRGRSLLLAVLDEAAFFRSGDGYEVNDHELHQAVAPRILPGGQVLIPSTPWIEAGLLHELFSANFGNPRTALAARCPTLLMRDDKQTRQVVERERERDPRNALREFDAQFGAGSEALLDPGDVDACVVPGSDGEQRMDGVRYAGAIDLATRGDFSVLLVGHHSLRSRGNGPPVDVVSVDAARHWAPNVVGRALKQKIDVDQLEADISAVAKHYRCGLVADGWGFDFIESRLSKRGIKLEQASMAPGVQSRRATAMASHFRQHRVELPENRELVRQLKGLLVSRLPGGGVRFAALSRRGHHDDYAKAMMLLVESVSALPATGGDVFVERSMTGHFNPHTGDLSGFERRWYRRNPDGSRTRCDAPNGTPEFERARESRFRQGVYTPADLEELGEQEVERRLRINLRVQ